MVSFGVPATIGNKRQLYQLCGNDFRVTSLTMGARRESLGRGCQRVPSTCRHGDGVRGHRAADGYRIKRVYLDGEQGLRVRPGLQRHCAGGTVQVEEWRVGAPPGAYDGPYWRAEWWARVPRPPSVAVRCGTRVRANGLTTSPSARSGGPGRRCPRPRWCAGNWPGCPAWRWWACPGRRWRRCFWDTITQVRAELAGSPGNDLRYFVRRVE